VLLPVKNEEQLLAARLLEFFTTSTPWHRALWNPGVVLCLRELLEASEAVRAGVLHEDSLRSLAEACARLAASDPGVGNEHQRHALQQTLQSQTKPKLRLDGLDYHVLKRLTDEIEADYLKRWAQALRGGGHLAKPERTARSAASYLLDLGFSPGHLHRWWMFKLQYEPGQRCIADILEDAHSLTKTQPKTFDVLILFKSSPRTKSGYPREWLDASRVSDWLKQNSFSVAGLRPSGGVVLSLAARDSEAASDLAEEYIDNFRARMAVGTGEVIDVLPKVWVAGEKEPRPLRRRVRGVRVRALYREDRVYPPTSQQSIIDAAVELLAHLEASSPGAAVAGGWAAIEALLSEPNDRGAAAERLASLVACSLPRAELTGLSYLLEQSDPSSRAELQGCTENRERCLVLARAIRDGRSLSLPEVSDQAALARMHRFLQSPRQTLEDVKTYVTDAFARLYRQRNLVLHWGKTNAVALRASLRTAAPLVGAGMDRIAHGYYVQKVRPMELAARARVSLATVEQGNIESCLDLLG